MNNTTNNTPANHNNAVPGGYKNIVVLVDGDNVNVTATIRAFRFIEELGHVTIKRVYGNWAKVQFKDWHDFIMRNGFTAVQQFDAVKGKNSTDIALTVDAIDIVNNRHDVDLFAIISSDSDYVAVAAYIRERGCRIIGFGNSATNVYYRNFLDEFYDDTKLPEKAVGIAELTAVNQRFKPDENITITVTNDIEYKLAKLHLIIYRVALSMMAAGKADSEGMLFCTSFNKQLTTHLVDGKRFLLSEFYSGSLWAYLKKFSDLYDTHDFGKLGKKFRCRYKNITVQKDPSYAGNESSAAPITDVEETTSASPNDAPAKQAGGTAAAKKTTSKSAAAKNAKTTADNNKKAAKSSTKNKAAKTTAAATKTTAAKPKTTAKTAAVKKATNKSAAAKTAKTAANNAAPKFDYRLSRLGLPEFSRTPSVILAYLYLASGKSIKAIAKDLSIATGSMSQYISGKTKFTTRADVLAKYFNVTEDFLMGKAFPVSYNALRHKVQIIRDNNEAIKSKNSGKKSGQKSDKQNGTEAI